MKKFNLKGMNEDIQHDRVTDEQLTYLIQSFESFIRDMGSAHSVTYDLSESALSRKYDCDKFTLTIEKVIIAGEVFYQGTYKNGLKRLSIISTLEEV